MMRSFYITKLGQQKSNDCCVCSEFDQLSWWYNAKSVEQ